MISYASLLSAAIACLVTKSTDAFSVHRSTPIHHRSLSSSTATAAMLDGITYESHQTYESESTQDDVMLILYHNDNVKVPDEYILDCIEEVIGMDVDDTKDAIYHSKTIGNVTELGTFPWEEGVTYYEQLKAMGIPILID